MDYRSIIASSWKETQNNKKLIFWFGFLPAILTTTVSAGYVFYQFFALKKSYLFNEVDESFSHEVLTHLIDFIQHNVSMTVPLIIFAIIFGILYFLFPTLAKASAVQMIARKRNNQTSGTGSGLRYGIRSFLPLLEYHLMIHTFTISGVFVEASFVIRNLGTSIFMLLSPVFILFLLIGLLMTLFFIYADFYIIIDDDGIFTAMRKSSRLVTNNLKHTFLITLLMVLIGIRIIIQLALVLLIPIVVILVTGYMAALTFEITGLVVGGIIGFAGLIFSAYLNGIVDIFAYHVWTFTFLEMSNEKELSARDVA